MDDDELAEYYLAQERNAQCLENDLNAMLDHDMGDDMDMDELDENTAMHFDGFAITFKRIYPNI